MPRHGAAFVLMTMLLAVCPVRDSAFSAETEPTVKTVTTPQKRPANRLKDTTSPYLLQHAHNPVDWYPWGDEAFAKARSEDKPVFLSVGYSACHWCHVMERECFENEALAKLLNEHFVAIKVDREERPDIDDLYMRYIHLVGQGGGWPMSVFMTPDAEPFYGGTYFPPDRFAQLLEALHKAWIENREKVNETAREAAEGLRQHARAEYRAPENPLSPKTTAHAMAMLARYFDWQHGGPQAPRKFPPHAMLEWLLDRVERTGVDTEERRMLKLTLDRMQLGGIHDHIGGGFHRYATDPEWFLPHFEKMLYDNAQLGRVYARASKVLGDPSYAATARGIYEWVLREMTSSDGAFFSSIDADSEGIEGRFYVWSAAEIEEVLGTEAGPFARYYNVSDKGNYREEATGQATGWNIPFLSEPLAPKVGEAAQAWRAKLLAARAGRVRPHLDDKVLTGWNALMIGSLAEGGRQLEEPRYLAAAERAAHWLLKKMRRDDGRWQASYRSDRVTGQATLDDYAYLSAAFLDLHEATRKGVWRDLAAETLRSIDRHFRDPERDGYFLIADDHEKLLVRLKNPADSATPSGNGIAVQSFVRLALATGDRGYRQRAEDLFNVFHPLMDLAPLQVESILRAFDQAIHAGWVRTDDAASASGHSKVQLGPVVAELLPGQDKLVAGGRAPFAVRLTIEEGHHVQAAPGAAGVTHPTQARVVSKALGQLQDVRYPPAGKLQLPEIGTVEVYRGEVVLRGWLEVPEGAPRGTQALRVEVGFQVCRNGACEAPQTARLTVPVEVVEAGTKVEPLNAGLFTSPAGRP